MGRMDGGQNVGLREGRAETRSPAINPRFLREKANAPRFQSLAAASSSANPQPLKNRWHATNQHRKVVTKFMKIKSLCGYSRNRMSLT
jgi:hypothetical protein